MINSVFSHKCSDCQTNGVVFFGDDNDFHIIPCECAITTDQPLTLDWTE